VNKISLSLLKITLLGLLSFNVYAVNHSCSGTQWENVGHFAIKGLPTSTNDGIFVKWFSENSGMKVEETQCLGGVIEEFPCLDTHIFTPGKNHLEISICPDISGENCTVVSEQNFEVNKDILGNYQAIPAVAQVDVSGYVARAAHCPHIPAISTTPIGRVGYR
jgi:hypothetical protein